MRKSLIGVGWLFAVLLLLSACTNPSSDAVRAEGLYLMVKVVSPLEVALSWNAVEGSQGYSLERKVAGEDFAVLATFADESASQTSYVDKTIKEGTSYIYRLTANVAGTPAQSDEASAEVPALGEPFALSVLPWSYAKDASGEPKKDTNSSGGSFKVAGQEYSQGLGTRLEAGMNSEIMYALAGNCSQYYCLSIIVC